MKSSDLAQAIRRANRAYEEACNAKESIRCLLRSAILPNDFPDSAWRRWIQPLAEQARQSVEMLFDVKHGLEELQADLQSFEEGEEAHATKDQSDSDRPLP